MTDLPLPDDEAQTVSDRLHQLIADRIQQAGGQVSFSDYMQWVLYEPILGYYSGGSAKLGETGDFITAPELGDLFGKTLARGIAPLLRQTEAQILELGAGTGRLAKAVLTELDTLGVQVAQYSILELSGELQSRQQALLRTDKRVQWLSVLPVRFSGVILANEVLDAMPVKLACLKGETWYERCVTCQDGQFCFKDCPASPLFLSQLAESLPEDIDLADLPEGYVTEIHPHALGFIRSLAAMMVSGKSAAVLVDYGFPAREYYLPERSEGTLICHYRHRVHDDPFHLPGLQDITAHLNFTVLAKIAETSGLDVLCYTDQAAFLMASDIMALLPVMDKKDAASAKLELEAMKLLSPAEMGELFKVMVLGHDVSTEALLQADRSGRL